MTIHTPFPQLQHAVAALALAAGAVALVACSPAAPEGNTTPAADIGVGADTAAAPLPAPVVGGEVPTWLGPGSATDSAAGFAKVLAGGAAAGALVIAPLGPSVAWDLAGRLMIAGGATVASGATDPLDLGSIGAASAKVLFLDPQARTLAAGPAPLATSRAWAASTRTTMAIIVAGGLAPSNDGFTAAGAVAWVDAVGHGLLGTPADAAAADLAFPRAATTAVRLFEGSDLALIVGGHGDGFAPQSWELASADKGVLAQGLLTGPRRNHGLVRVPAGAAGSAVLVGGENGGGAISDFELIRFDAAGKVARADHPDPDWQPTRQAFPSGVGLTLPGVAFVDRPGARLIAIAGGFSDLAHSQPSNALLLFDVDRGQWVTGTFEPSKALASGGAWVGVPQAFALQEARGAPLMASVGAGGATRLLIAGGVGKGGDTLDSAEVWEPDELADAIASAVHTGVTLTWTPKLAVIEARLPDGGRAHAQMAVHPAGYVAIVGGVSRKAGALEGRADVLFWRP